MGQEHLDSANVFDAAKKIVETLKDLPKPQQEQALRFASEALGLSPLVHAQMPPQPPVQPPAAPGSAIPLHSNDIRQFTALKAPKSDQQFAAVVAFFYQFEAPSDQRKDAISAKDLTDAARLAGRTRPKRPVVTLNNAKQAGYLDATERGKFRISTVGENLVAVTLPGGEAAGVGSRQSPRKKRSGKDTKRKSAKLSAVKR